MATIEKHQPGSFCWVELGTTDQGAAKSFYSSLFGWNANDFPMGPDGLYTTFDIGGRHTGAAYTLNAQMREHGVPPHWMLYIAVENVDETAAKATAAGGKIEAGPFDVFDAGRMAVIRDPTGAYFAIWQAKTHAGLGLAGEPGTLCWADISTPDVPAAQKFYETVFGWQITAGEKDPSGYLHIKNGDNFIGGVPSAGQRDPNSPPHWLLYFLVSDCDATTDKAKEMGARVLFGPFNIENAGRFSVLADPQGAVFSPFQAQPRAA